jgi:hypothetical protein
MNNLKVKGRIKRNQMQRKILRLLNNQITNYTAYEPDTCVNGGAYAYTETLRYDPTAMQFYVTYSTSSEFNYCRFCGDFHSQVERGCKPQFMTRYQLYKFVDVKIHELRTYKDFTSSFPVFDIEGRVI